MKKWMALLLVFVLVMSMQAVSLAEAYTATAQGFGGDVTVTLTIDNGVLTAVEAEGKGETEGIGTRALDMLPAAMLEQNTVAVDAVAGATVTSKAIQAAAADALAQSGVTLEAKAAAEASAMIPGVYTGSAKGFHETLSVEVEVTEDAITRVTVGENGETVLIGTLAIPMLEESIVKNQSLADTVSGATFTSNAINGAVAEALKAAGANAATLNAFMNREIPAENPGDTETDVVVVGAGTAGMVAAMNAHDQGADVILLEKVGITGGSTRLSFGCIWGLNQPEVANEYTFTADDVHEFFSRWAGPIHSDEVFYKVVGNTENGLSYLRENDFVVAFPAKSHEKQAPQFTSVVHAGNGPGFADMLEKNIVKRGIDLRYNSPAVELVMNEDGSVGGVVVEGEAGRYTIKAKKVILATGGFTYDAELMAQYANGHDYNNMTWSGIGGTGDGHKMGVAAGGTLVGTGTLNINGVDGRQDSFFDMMTLFTYPIVVDKNGNQICAMDEHYTTISKKITETEEGKAYVIYDANVTGSMAELEALVADGDAWKADTLEELAQMMGINAENLIATIDNHNKHYDEQTDDEWTTPAAALIPIKEGPFYGYRKSSFVMGTITGLEVNTDMQVIREDGTAIENLYATGELMFGNIFNEVYPMSGTALTTCISSGQIASDHAVQTMAE